MTKKARAFKHERIGCVCENGHIRYYWNDMGFTPEYCHRCGKPLFRRCLACGERILFPRPKVEGDCDSGVPPFYCENCGKPFPWNTSKGAMNGPENEE